MSPMVDLKTIDERLAKIREEAEFLERARALLADPRMEQLLGERIVSSPTPAPPAATTSISMSTNGAGRRPHGELKRKVLEMLPPEDSTTPISTKEIVRNLIASGYILQAKDHEMAVNAALVSLE